MLSQEEQVRATIAFAKEKLGQDRSGHGLDHLHRVARMAQRLAAKSATDPFIPTIASYLHDTIDEKLFADVDQAQRAVQDFLAGHDFSAAQTAEIMFIITHMSYAQTLVGGQTPLPLAGQIVQDADWLDAIGAIGIARAVYYGGKHHQKLYDPQMPVRTHLTKEDYRDLSQETIINHVSEKLFKLKGMLNTPAAKEIAAHRDQVMHDFVDEFLAEWRGEDE